MGYGVWEGREDGWGGVCEGNEMCCHFQKILENTQVQSKCHKVPGSMISTEPPCTCLSYCFPCNTWINVSHSKLGIFDKNYQNAKTSACGGKKERTIFIPIRSDAYVLGTGRRINSVSIKETRAYCFLLLRCGTKKTIEITTWIP